MKKKTKNKTIQPLNTLGTSLCTFRKNLSLLWLQTITALGTLLFSFHLSLLLTCSRHTGLISYTLNVPSRTVSTEPPISFAHCSFSLPSTGKIHISRISERLSLATVFIFGCAGPSLLRGLFPGCGEQGLLSSCGERELLCNCSM